MVINLTLFTIIYYMSLLSLGFHCLTLTNNFDLLLINTYNKKCDLKRPHVKARPYIVNGQPSIAYPFIVGIGGFKPNTNTNLSQIKIGPWVVDKDSKWIPLVSCTGTIIHRRWVLTAAHCLKYQHHFVMAGSWLKLPEKQQHYFPCQSVIRHEEYNKTGLNEHDLGVAKVKKALSVLDTTSKVFLANKYIQYGMAIVAGFGKLDRNRTISSPTLREVILENKEKICQTFYKHLFNIDKQTCAGTIGKGISGGDSGGPLFTMINDKYVQLGIVSWDNGEEPIKHPTVFTRVSSYLEWLSVNTAGSFSTFGCSI